MQWHDPAVTAGPVLRLDSALLHCRWCLWYRGLVQDASSAHITTTCTLVPRPVWTQVAGLSSQALHATGAPYWPPVHHGQCPWHQVQPVHHMLAPLQGLCWIWCHGGCLWHWGTSTGCELFVVPCWTVPGAGSGTQTTWGLILIGPRDDACSTKSSLRTIYSTSPKVGPAQAARGAGYQHREHAGRTASHQTSPPHWNWCGQI